MTYDNNLNRKRKTRFPCPECGFHPLLCICREIPTLDLQTKFTLIIHQRETKRTTNSGMLAAKALTNSQVIVRGLIGQPTDLSDCLDDKYQPLLLYPSSNAQELNADFLKGTDKPAHLLVPDGNWRQASKVHYRHKELQAVPRVFVGKPDNSMDILRKETKDLGMATLLAIALAFRVLESEEIYELLLRLFRRKLENTVKARGRRKP